MKHFIYMLLLGTILVALTSCSEGTNREVVSEPTEIVETSNVALGGKSEALQEFYMLIETEAEGSFFPVINYGFYEWFTPYASNEIRMFYELMKDESDYAPQKDGGLTISWEDVLKRALAFESYMLRFPDGVLSERATELYQRYRTIALEGTINTSLFDRDTLKMRPEAITEYKAFAEALALKKLNTDFEKLIFDYSGLLKQSQYVKTEKIASFIDSNR